MADVIKLRNKKTGEIITIRRKKPRIAGVIKAAPRALRRVSTPYGEQIALNPEFIQQKFRNWLLSGRAGQPSTPPVEMIKRTFTDRFQDVESERARAFSEGMLNTLAFGIPQLAIEKGAGLQLPPTTTPVAEFAGEMAGIRPILGVSRAAAKGIIGEGLGAKVLRGAVSGGVTGALLPPEKSADLKARAQRAIGLAGAGAGLALAGGVASNLRKLRTKQSAAFARRIREAFVQVKKKAVEKFGGKLDELVKLYPERKVSLRPLVEELADDLSQMSPQARAALRSVPKLKTMLKEPEYADKVTLKDVQKIINYLETKIPKNIKATHLEIIDTVNDLKAAQLEAFPEMADVRAEYAKIIEPYNNIKNHFKFGRLLKSIEKGFNDAETRETVKKLLPPEIIKEMGSYKNTILALRALKRAGWLIPMYAGYRAVGNIAENIGGAGGE